jgi:serine/threonine-protein kinase
LTGEKPFAGESPKEILRSQLDRSAFQNPRDLNPDIPPGLEKAILRCVEKDPDKRYPIASVLVHDLETILYV